MAKEKVNINDYSWEYIHGAGEFEGNPHMDEYPNIGYDNKDPNLLVELSHENNVSIRPATSKIIMSPKAKIEWQKCKDDMFYFFDNYCYIHNQDVGKMKLSLRPYQYEFLECIKDNAGIIGMMARQIGKCVKKDTVINVRNKKTGLVEEISIETFHNRFK